MVIQHLIGPTSLSPSSIGAHSLSVLSYNVLLPNSQDGWWTYKMYNPPLSNEERESIASWDYRRDLIKERLATVDAGIVCLQEVAPDSFEEDFAFMKDLGYDCHEMYRKGRFRPASFWKSSMVELAAPPVHKDRTLLTAFRPKNMLTTDKDERNWYVLNCHLQAGSEAPRRVRQINEGMKAIMTLARKLKEPDPEKTLPVIVCGDFNGGQECGAVQYLENGFIDETFREDGAPVSSGRKDMPLESPMVDVMDTLERVPPPTLVVSELISQLVKGRADEAYQTPSFNKDTLDRLTRIYKSLATSTDPVSGDPIMSSTDVEKWLVAINGQVGRGSEFREAVKQMTIDKDSEDGDTNEEFERPRVVPTESYLSLEGFQMVYTQELRQGKFWGIAHDLAILGEPLPDVGNYEGRYDRLYCSTTVSPLAVMDFLAEAPCPSKIEPSDHLPIAAAFELV